MVKNSTLHNTFRAYLGIGLTIAACEGPAVPQGEQESQRPPGEDGTANVMYSDWVDIDWKTADEVTSKLMRIPESRITKP